MKQMRAHQRKWFAVPYLVLFSILFLHGQTHAATFCVSTAADLEEALLAAASNGEDDVIQLVQGTYAGNFVYFSDESQNLNIEGGHDQACSMREVDSTNTVLDGLRTGTVLALNSTQKAGIVADFVVDGLTLQNGVAPAVDDSVIGGRGGGVFVSTRGSVTLT